MTGSETAVIGTVTGSETAAGAVVVTVTETGGAAVAAAGTATGGENAHGPGTGECSEGLLVPSVAVLVAELVQGGVGLEVH